MNNPLSIPPQLFLTVTPAAYELIRGLLGKQPLDQVIGLVSELEQQVSKQIADFNAPAAAPDAAGSDPQPASP